MRRVTYINRRGDSIEFSDTEPFILINFDTSNDVTIYSYKGVNQDGANYLKNLLEPRECTLEVVIEARNRDHLLECKSHINRILSPKLGEGYIICADGSFERKLRCIVDRLPYFVDESPIYAKGLISLKANNPFWLDDIETSEEIVTWIGGMSFPLRLPTQFGKKGPRKINIINDGDVETPVKIEFKGPATNPRVINHTTSEYIQVNRMLLQDDVLVITTEFGNKRVEINGQNVFNWVDLNSTFWQLQPGDNIIEYNSDDEIEPAAVKISYRNRYLGV